jgi:hypothetical protein
MEFAGERLSRAPVCQCDFVWRSILHVKDRN